MSLFHVLKYSVSCPPTISELNNLPTEVLCKYLDDVISDAKEKRPRLNIRDLQMKLINYLLEYEEENIE